MKKDQYIIVGLLIALTAVVTARFTSTESRAQSAAPTPAPTTNPAEIGSMTPLRGLDVAVRSTGESEFTPKTSRVPVEAYRDEDFGTLTYISGNGSISSMPQPHNFELRQLPFDKFYETVRFSPISGVAWRLNLRTAKWQIIEEAGTVPPGDYDIDMFHVTDSTMVVMRIDQLTGKTWTMTSVEGKPDKWSEIAEPEPVKDAAAAK